MKRAILFSSLFLACGLLLNAQTTQKIGYVDSQVIMQQYPAAIKAQGELEATAQKWVATRDSMANQLKADYTDFQKKAQNMKPEKQKEAQQKLMAQEQAVQKFNQDKFSQTDGEYAKKQAELLAPVKDKIMKAINELSKEMGINFVFDSNGNFPLLYADSAFDLTFKVLDRLKTVK